MINKPLYVKALFLAGVHQGGVGLTGHGLLEFPPNFPKKKTHRKESRCFAAALQSITPFRQQSWISEIKGSG